MFEMGPQYASDSLHVSILNYLSSQYFRVLSMPLVLNMPQFEYIRNLPGSEYASLVQGSEYTSGSLHARVLNIPRFSISQGSDYTRVLYMPLVLNMPQLKYTRILTRILDLPGLH